jgi:uncharacterized membrane protein YqgA involved in biofilm formation
MKDGLIYWYFRLREWLVVGLALLVLIVGVLLLVFQPELFFNIFAVIVGTILGAFLLLAAGVMLWALIDKLMPADPRKSKEDE